MKLAAASIKGKRLRNEDQTFFRQEGARALVVVADGMGGHQAGGIASSIAVETVEQELSGGAAYEDIVNAVSRANSAVYRYSTEHPECRGMGTTIVLALLEPERYLAANIGDSRLYHFSGGVINRITRDHSFVAELVRSGQITEEEAAHHPARNIITRALGTQREEKIDIYECAWKRGDVLMLCSDGLYGVLDDREMARVLQQEGDLQQACDALVQIALYGNSTDNISVVLAKNEEAGE